MSEPPDDDRPKNPLTRPSTMPQPRTPPVDRSLSPVHPPVVRPRLFGDYGQRSDPTEQSGRIPIRPAQTGQAFLEPAPTIKRMPALTDEDIGLTEPLKQPDRASLIERSGLSDLSGSDVLDDEDPTSDASRIIVGQMLWGESSDNPLEVLAREATRVLDWDFVQALREERLQDILNQLQLVQKDDHRLADFAQQLKKRQSLRITQIQNKFEGALAVWNFDVATAQLTQLELLTHDRLLLSVCEADYARTLRRHRDRQHFEERWQAVADLSKSGAFLASLRDARTILQELLENKQFDDIVDAGRVRRVLVDVEQRIGDEEQSQDELSTLSAVDDIGANLAALADYQARAKRGERSVRFREIAGLVPITKAIEDTRHRVRQTATQILTRHISAATRFLDEGRIEEAIRRLTQRTELWQHADSALKERIEALHGDLQSMANAQDESRVLAERVWALVQDKKYSEAIAAVDLNSVSGPQSAVRAELRRKVLDRWLGPPRARYNTLVTAIEKVDDLPRLDALHAQSESLSKELTELAGQVEEIDDLHRLNTELLRYIDDRRVRFRHCDTELIRAEKMAAQGERDELRETLAALAEHVPERRADIAALKRRLEISIDRTEALALAIRLVRSKPTEARRLCEPYRAHDNEFAQIAIEAEVCEARDKIELLEGKEDFDMALKVARALERRLSGDHQTEAQQLVERLTTIRDHAPTVATQLPLARQALEAGRTKEVLTRLDGLVFTRRQLVEADLLRRAAIADLCAHRRAEVEDATNHADDVGGHARLAAVSTAVAFLQRYSRHQPDNVAVLERYRFISQMAVAREHLQTGDVDSAIETATELIGTGPTAKITAFVNECRVHRFSTAFQTAVSILDFDTAKRLLHSTSIGEANEVIQARRLISACQPLIEALAHNDAISAWRRVEVISQRYAPPRPPYFDEMLNRVRQQRIDWTVAQCEALRSDGAPGHTFAQIDLLIREADSRSASDNPPQITALRGVVDEELPDDLEILLTHAISLEQRLVGDLKVLGQAIFRLKIARKWGPEESRPQVVSALNALMERYAEAQRVVGNQQEINRLVERGIAAQEIAQVERARELAEGMNADTGEIEALLRGWRDADTQVRNLQLAVKSGRIAAAEACFRSLEVIRSKTQIPHLDYLIIDGGLGEVGPGASAVKLGLASLRKHVDLTEQQLLREFTEHTKALDAAIESRKEILGLVETDEPEIAIDEASRRALVLTQKLKRINERVIMAQHEVLTEHLRDKLKVLADRIHTEAFGHLKQQVSERRRALEADFTQLRGIYGLDQEALNQQMGIVTRLEERWKGSGRIAVWSKATRVKAGKIET